MGAWRSHASPPRNAPRKPTPSTIQPTLAEQAAGVQPLDAPDENVLLSLGIEPGKKPRATRRTLLTIFEADPRWAGRARLDRFRDSIVVDSDGLTDRDVTRIACWVEAVYGVNPSRDLMVECLSAVAADNSFHPVLVWAATLRWDVSSGSPGWSPPTSRRRMTS